MLDTEVEALKKEREGGGERERYGERGGLSSWNILSGKGER